MVKTKVWCIIAPRKISFIKKDLKINDEFPLEKLDEAFNRYDKDPNVIKLAVKS
jgi:hypothetical protein